MREPAALTSEVMRAIQFDQFGGPEVLRVVEVPDPHPAADQIRVVVRAVGINPVDWKIRSGMMGGELPRFTGLDVAGVVDEVGEAVTDVTAGDEVFGPAVGGAGAADRAILENYARIPPSLDFTTAAALPVAVETAARTLDLLGAGEGQTVLINGAAGAIGICAVQIARSRGARVIGTASEPNHDYLRGYGAEPTTYGSGLAERVRELAPGGVDAALDAAGGGALSDLIALTGGPERVVTIADYQGAQETGATFSGGLGSKRAWYALALAGELAEAGALSLPVAETFSLEQIGRAHERSETGHVRGKIVLLVSE